MDMKTLGASSTTAAGQGRRRNRRFSTNAGLYTNGTGGTDLTAAGMSEYARAVYVPMKAYGTFTST
jgi:hypothetical protein